MCSFLSIDEAAEGRQQCCDIKIIHGFLSVDESAEGRQQCCDIKIIHRNSNRRLINKLNIDQRNSIIHRNGIPLNGGLNPRWFHT